MAQNHSYHVMPFQLCSTCAVVKKKLHDFDIKYWSTGDGYARLGQRHMHYRSWSKLLLGLQIKCHFCSLVMEHLERSFEAGKSVLRGKDAEHGHSCVLKDSFDNSHCHQGDHLELSDTDGPIYVAVECIKVTVDLKAAGCISVDEAQRLSYGPPPNTVIHLALRYIYHLKCTTEMITSADTLKIENTSKGTSDRCEPIAAKTDFV